MSLGLHSCCVSFMPDTHPTASHTHPCTSGWTAFMVRCTVRGACNAKCHTVRGARGVSAGAERGLEVVAVPPDGGRWRRQENSRRLSLVSDAFSRCAHVLF